MRTRQAILAIGACAVLGIGAAGCGSDDNKDKESSSKKAGSVVPLSTAAKKLTSASADAHGLTGRSKARPKTGSATGLQPGDQLDVSGLPQNIIQTVKQQAGIDVQVQCPSTVAYSPGSTFYCQLTTPDGTAYQVECIQQEGGGIQWKVVTTQPTPPPPPGPTPGKLKGNNGKVKAARATGTSALQEGDQLDLSTLPSQIETEVKNQTGLDVNVECPATTDYSPGSTFYCKLYTSDGTAYDVECTQAQGGINWRVLVKQATTNAAPSRLSSDAKKIVSLSARDHGLADDATKPKSTGATNFSQGDAVDTQFIADDIVRWFKENKGLDVRVDCPTQVRFALDAVFYCKLYAPDNTSFDVRVSWVDADTAHWEVLTGQPTPPPPPGPTPQQLNSADGKGKTTGQAGPQPGDPISTAQLEQQIAQAVKQKTGIDVTVDCPDTVTYSPGSTFYCKLMTADGTPYDVEVTQGQNLSVTWRVITRPTQPQQP